MYLHGILTYRIVISFRTGVINTAYYSDYADHMWRFYIRHRNNDPECMPAPQRSDWIACDNVFKTLAPTWRDIVSIRYSQWPDRQTMNRQVSMRCASISIRTNNPDLDISSIITTVRRRAAEERGLKDPSDCTS